MSETETNAKRAGAEWLQAWEPENESFWNTTGKGVAWRTLWVTTFNLTLAFIAWFVVSAAVVRLPNIGFELNKTQLFWLAAMPGLSAGTLRLLHMFLIPIFGTRKVVTVSTLRCSSFPGRLGMAVQNPILRTECSCCWRFWQDSAGDFSSFMHPPACFFPSACRERRSLFGPASATSAELVHSSPRGLSASPPGPCFGPSQTFTKMPSQNFVAENAFSCDTVLSDRALLA